MISSGKAKEYTEEEFKEISKTVGIAAIKYADLSS